MFAIITLVQKLEVARCKISVGLECFELFSIEFVLLLHLMSGLFAYRIYSSVL